MRARAEQVSPVVLVNYQLVDGTCKGRLSFRKGEGEGEGCSSEWCRLEGSNPSP